MKPSSKALLMSVVICMFAFLSSACSQAGLAVINLWAKTGSFEVSKNIAYGEHRLQALDVYTPQDTAADSTLPVVLFFYGGCWGGCSTYEKAHYRFVADTLTAQGYVVAIADYRRYPEFLIEPILQDAAAATAWVANNIADFGGNKQQIFLAGHSAGAHLAIMTMLDKRRLNAQQQQQIAGFIGLAGPYDFLPHTEAYQEVLFGPPDSYGLTQPINYVAGDEPPMLLLWGDADTSVFRKNIINMEAKVAELGGTAQTHIYADMSHVEILTRLARPFKNKPAKKPTTNQATANNSTVLADIRAFIDAYTKAND